MLSRCVTELWAAWWRSTDMWGRECGWISAKRASRSHGRLTASCWAAEVPYVCTQKADSMCWYGKIFPLCLDTKIWWFKTLQFAPWWQIRYTATLEQQLDWCVYCFLMDVGMVWGGRPERVFNFIFAKSSDSPNLNKQNTKMTFLKFAIEVKYDFYILQMVCRL